jgi:hypothetical protein
MTLQVSQARRTQKATVTHFIPTSANGKTCSVTTACQCCTGGAVEVHVLPRHPASTSRPNDDKPLLHTETRNVMYTLAHNAGQQPQPLCCSGIPSTTVWTTSERQPKSNCCSGQHKRAPRPVADQARPDASLCCTLSGVCPQDFLPCGLAFLEKILSKSSVTTLLLQHSRPAHCFRLTLVSFPGQLTAPAAMWQVCLGCCMLQLLTKLCCAHLSQSMRVCAEAGCACAARQTSIPELILASGHLGAAGVQQECVWLLLISCSALLLLLCCGLCWWVPTFLAAGVAPACFLPA